MFQLKKLESQQEHPTAMTKYSQSPLHFDAKLLFAELLKRSPGNLVSGLALLPRGELDFAMGQRDRKFMDFRS